MKAQQPNHQTLYEQNKHICASISLYPGAAQGAWKRVPVIPLPRHHALLQAYPPFSDHPKDPCS